MIFSKHELVTIGAILITILSALLLPTTVFAHNKVVVIPMAGDEILPKPSSPVTKESPPNSDYIINGLISVVDKVTGLEWQRVDDNATRTFDAAFQYCIDLSLDGINDWRLPLITELLSIVDHGAFNPSINTDAFLGTDSSLYWSASSVASNSSYAWSVDFERGSVGNGVDRTSPYYVRCVR